MPVLAGALVWLLASASIGLAADEALSDTERQRFAMIEAGEHGDVSAINRLLTVGTKVDVRDESRRTALYMAVTANRVDAVKLLLSEGASVNAQARDFQTPWLLAASLGRADMLRLMIPFQPDLTIRDRFGGTALHPACEKGHLEVVRVLLETAIEVNHANTFGWTCLIELASFSDGGPRAQEIATLVVKAGGDPNIRDRRGRSALAHAQTRGLVGLAARLKALGAR